MKKTIATNWTKTGKDETGAMIYVDFVCPHCNNETGELVYIRNSDLDGRNRIFETMPICLTMRQKINCSQKQHPKATARIINKKENAVHSKKARESSNQTNELDLANS